MRPIHLLLCSALLLTGCGDQRPAVETTDQPQPTVAADEAQWHTTLEPDADRPQLRGSATAVNRGGSTAVNVQLAGGVPGAVHPWHIHLGPCGTHGDYFHEADTYAPLQLDEQGRGTAQATVPEQLQPGETYHVNVHGADDHDATVACGELRRG